MLVQVPDKEPMEMAVVAGAWGMVLGCMAEQQRVHAGWEGVLTISSGFQTPSCMDLTRFTGALLGVKRSMVDILVVAAAAVAHWALLTACPAH